MRLTSAIRTGMDELKGSPAAPGQQSYGPHVWRVTRVPQGCSSWETPRKTRAVKRMVASHVPGTKRKGILGPTRMAKVPCVLFTRRFVRRRTGIVVIMRSIIIPSHSW